MRTDPLAYLDEELNSLREQGLFRPLRVLDGEQARARIDRPSLGRQSLVEQLPRSDDAPATSCSARSRRSRRSASARARCARSPARWQIHMELERRLAAFKQTEAAVVFQSGFTANAGTVSLAARPRRRHRLRRAESRQHHRRRPLEPRHDQSVSAPRRRGRARDPGGPSRATANAAHHRRRVQHGRRPRRAARSSATSPTSSAAS